jgi:hypothetical protein
MQIQYRRNQKIEHDKSKIICLNMCRFPFVGYSNFVGTVLPGICLRRNSSVTDYNELGCRQQNRCRIFYWAAGEVVKM